MSDFFGSLGDAFGGNDLGAGNVADAVTAADAGNSSSGGGFFGNLLGGLNLGQLANAGAKIGGALLTTNANNNAASTAANGAVQSAEIQAAANKQATDEILQAQQDARNTMLGQADKGLAAIDTGSQQYANTINPLLTPNPIVIPSYRDLTPQQQTGEQDLLRNGLSAISASGMRGAGRAGIGAVLDQDRRYQEDVRSQNDADTRAEMRRAQGVADNARQGLATEQSQVGGAKANTDLLTGSNLASSFQQGGNSAANLTANTGQVQGNATQQAANTNAAGSLANANILGSTLGGLGAIFANPSMSYSGTSGV